MDGPQRVTVAIKRLRPYVALPSYAHPGDAGLDLSAAEQVTIAPGAWAAVPTGVAVGLPDGWVGLVMPRSGLARRHGLAVLNAPGVVDAGYRGEVTVLLVNHGPEAVDLVVGDRIAQLVVQRVGWVELEEVEELDATVRGAGAFGSSGR